MSTQDNYHGNDKRNKKKQHLYRLLNMRTEDDNTHKYGISGTELNKDGSSPRANGQVNKLNKERDEDIFDSEILKTEINGRAKALDLEKDYVEKYQNEHRNEMPPGQQRPNMKKEKK